MAAIVKGGCLLPKPKIKYKPMKITTKQLALLAAGVGLIGFICTWALNKAKQ